jgi:PKD domain-containing protein
VISGHKTVLKEVDQPLTDSHSLKYELDYSRTGESSVSEVSNFTSEARPDPGSGSVAGDPVTLDGSASFDAGGSVESYEWDFGDGTTVSGSQASRVYEKPGR